MTRAEILHEAEKCVCTDREQSYGSPEDNFGIIAKLWSVYLDKEITSADVAWMMIMLKIARCKSGQFKDDNAIDICGYAACGGEILGSV